MHCGPHNTEKLFSVRDFLEFAEEMEKNSLYLKPSITFNKFRTTLNIKSPLEVKNCDIFMLP